MDVSYLDDYLPEPISTIDLVCDYDIPSLLPSSFYHLSCLLINDDRCTTHTLEDGGDSYYLEGLLYGWHTADWRLLPSTDYMCLLKGWLELACTSQSLFSTTQIGNCHSNDICVMILQVGLTQIREACRQVSDPLELARCYLEQDRFSDQACTTCCGYIQKELGTFHSMVWNKLPKYFGLQWNAPVLCNCVLHVILILILLLIAVVVLGQNVQIAL